MSPQSRWQFFKSSTWLMIKLRFHPWTSYTRQDCLPFKPAWSTIASSWSWKRVRAWRISSSSRKMAGLLSRRKWHSSIDFSNATIVRCIGAGRHCRLLPPLFPPPLLLPQPPLPPSLVSIFKTGNYKRTQRHTEWCQLALTYCTFFCTSNQHHLTRSFLWNT